MYKASERDLFAKRLDKNTILFSTMINFSSRFPLFSPAACVTENDVQKRHYVDGGYIENTGASTMKEILMALKPTMDKLLVNDSIRIEPYVIMIRFGKASEKIPTINFANELSEIIYGIYNTRVGRTDRAVYELIQYLDSIQKNHFINITLDMDGRKVPMNWVLSKHSLDNLKADVDSKWNHRHTNELRKLPWK